MRIKCNVCGKFVSTEVLEGTLIRAWVECPECIEKQWDREEFITFPSVSRPLEPRFLETGPRDLKNE